MLSTLALVLALAAANRPNIVLVISDDQGYGDLSCHGNPVLETPNLDALHSDAVRLIDYHVAPTCSPTRASLLTGHWTNRTLVWHTIAGRSILKHEEQTLPEILKAGGYRTAMFGKWHLGDNYPNRPGDRGFDEVFCHGGGGVGQTPDHWDNAYFDGTYTHNGEPEAVTGHCTDVWFDAAESFIKTEAASEKPFFVYLATNAPHGPMHSRPDYAEPYADYPTKVQHFLGMIAHIDDRVGQLRETIEAAGVADDTLFIFTTDNGTSAGAKVYNAGMRGTKGSNYEGGHRVPSFWHWPGGTLAGGRDVTLPAHAADMLPTLLDFADIDVPSGLKPDGMSIAPSLRGQQQDIDRVIVTDSQRVRTPTKWKTTAVIDGKWRLTKPSELYDIESDPGQKNNVAAANAEVVSRLTAAYDDWWDDVSQVYDEVATIVLGNDAENPATLTGHDWYVDNGVTPWNQAAIRSAANLQRDDNVWNVTFEQQGTYRVTARRWPFETGYAVDAAVPAGEAVPGEKAFREAKGKPLPLANTTLHVTIAGGPNGTLEATQSLEPSNETWGEESSITLQVDELGDRTLAVVFVADGEQYAAPYVQVERLATSANVTPADGAASLAELPVAPGKRPKTMGELRKRLEGTAKVVRPKLDPADGVRVIEAIPFVTRGDEPQLLDVYLPAGEGPHPVVMLVHGGGWRKGSRTNDQPKGVWLANRGIAAVAINYRLGDAHPYPALMHDLQQAIAWLRSDRHSYPLDKDRLVLLGGSAGATMVALHATSHGETSLLDPELPPNVSLAVDGAVVIAGPTNTEGPDARRESMRKDSNYHVLLRGSIDDEPTKYRTFNPTHWASGGMPPLVLIDENSGRQTEDLRPRLDAIATPYEHYVFENVAHSSWNNAPWFDFTMERTKAFAERVWNNGE